MKKIISKYKPSEYANIEKTARDLKRRRIAYSLTESNAVSIIETPERIYQYTKPVDDVLCKTALIYIKNIGVDLIKAVSGRFNGIIARGAKKYARPCDVYFNEYEDSTDIYEVDLKSAYIAALQKYNILAGGRTRTVAGRVEQLPADELPQITKLREALPSQYYDDKAKEKILKKVRLIAVGRLSKTVEVIQFNPENNYTPISTKIKPCDVDFLEKYSPTICEPVGFIADRLPRVIGGKHYGANLFASMICARVKWAKKADRVDAAPDALAFPSDVFSFAANTVARDMDKIRREVGGVYIKWVDALFCRGDQVAAIEAAAARLGYHTKTTRHKRIFRVGGVVTVEMLSDNHKYCIDNGALIINDKKTFNASGTRESSILKIITNYFARERDSSEIARHIEKYGIISDARVRQTLARFGLGATRVAQLRTQDGWQHFFKMPAAMLAALDGAEVPTEEVEFDSDESLKLIQKRRIETALLAELYERWRTDDKPATVYDLDESELRNFAVYADYCVDSGEYTSAHKNAIVGHTQAHETIQTKIKINKI